MDRRSEIFAILSLLFFVLMMDRRSETFANNSVNRKVVRSNIKVDIEFLFIYFLLANMATSIKIVILVF